MITDAVFYRNKNYHSSKDKMETLDITKMSQLVNAICETLIELE